MEINYTKANKASKELVRGCIVVGIVFALAALAMVWEIDKALWPTSG